MSEDPELAKLRDAVRALVAPPPPRPSIAHLPLLLTLEALTSPDPLGAMGALVEAGAAVQKAKTQLGKP